MVRNNSPPKLHMHLQTFVLDHFMILSCTLATALMKMSDPDIRVANHLR